MCKSNRHLVSSESCVVIKSEKKRCTEGLKILKSDG